MFALWLRNTMTAHLVVFVAIFMCGIFGFPPEVVVFIITLTVQMLEIAIKISASQSRSFKEIHQNSDILFTLQGN